MGPFGFRSPRITSALFALNAVVALGALGASAAGCKLERAKVRAVREKPKAKLHPPRTLRGSFVMGYEPSTGKRFPVHMSFAAEFSQDGRGLVLSTCVDGLGGMEKTEYKSKIQPDVEIPMGLAGGSSDAAKGVKVSGFRCAKDEALQARAQDAAGGPSGSSPSRSDATPSDASEGASAATNTPAGSTAAAPANTGPSASGGTATGGSSGNSGNSASSANGASPSAGDSGSFTFVSKPDAKGNSIRLTLRANDAGWQIENLSYYGSLAWVEETETVAQWIGQ